MRISIKSAGVLAGVLTASTLAAGCGSDGGSTSDEKTLTVGMIQPYSGSASYYGRYADDAWELAMEDFGGDAKIEVVTADSKCEPSTAISASQQVMAKKPIAVITPLCSGDTLAIMDNIAQRKVPVIAPNLVPEITQRGSGYVWRIPPSDDQSNQKLAEYIKKQGHKSIGLIHDTTGYGQANGKSMENALAGIGLPPKVVASYDFGDTDYSGPLLALKKAGVEAAYIEGYDAQQAGLVRQAENLGLNIPIYTPTTANSKTFKDAAKDAAKNVTYVTSYLPSWSESAEKFADRWQDRFDYPVNSDAVMLYAAAAMTISSVVETQESGDVTGEKLNDVISAATLDGLPAGRLSFEENGDPKNPLIVVGTWDGDVPRLIEVLQKPDTD